MIDRLGLCRRPLLRAVQDSQYLHLIVHFIDCDERKRNKNEFASALDASAASQVWKRFKCRDTSDDGLRNPSCRIGAAFADVVTNPLEIVRRVRRP